MNTQDKNVNYLSTLKDEIINNHAISDVIKNYLTLTKKGKDFKALCPFHSDKNPSFSISDDRKCFNCFVCNIKGNAISFVMKYLNLSYVDAIKEIATKLNIPFDLSALQSNSIFSQEDEEIFSINEKAAFLYHKQLSFNKDALNYLVEDRKLSLSLIKEYQIGYAPHAGKRDFLCNAFLKSTDENLNRPALLNKAGLISLNNHDEYYDFFDNRIIIPITNEYKKIVGFSGRTMDKEEKIKYLNTKTTKLFKKEEILFNLAYFDKNLYSDIYLVEGYMDVFALKKIGIENVVATMGTAFGENHIKVLKKYKKIKNVIVCFDTDNAGINATKEVVEKLNKANFTTFIVKPNFADAKDVDELVKNNSLEQAKKIINDQISFVQYAVYCHQQEELTYKEKKLKTQELINYINAFAYNPLLISDDIKAISDFAQIPESEICAMIYQKKQNFYKNQKPQYKSQMITKNIASEVFKEYQENDYVLKSNVKKNQFDWGLEKYKTYEKDLILLLLFSERLLDLYNKYIGFILFNNSGCLNTILRTILNFCNSNEEVLTNPSQYLKEFVKSDEFKELSDDEAKYFENLIKKFCVTKKLNFIEEFSSFEKKIFYDGINAIIFLVDVIYKNRIASETDLNSSKKREELKIEREQKIKEIKTILDEAQKANINSK